MSDIPRNPRRRYSVDQAGQVFAHELPAGEPLLRASSFFVPTAEETRKSILQIRRKFRLSRAQLAVALGVGKDSLRRWETAERTPCTAARRLVQLLEGLFFSREDMILGFGAVLVGRIDLEALERTRHALLLAPARRFLDRFEQARAQSHPSGAADGSDIPTPSPSTPLRHPLRQPSG